MTVAELKEAYDNRTAELQSLKDEAADLRNRKADRLEITAKANEIRQQEAAVENARNAWQSAVSEQDSSAAYRERRAKEESAKSRGIHEIHDADFGQTHRQKARDTTGRNEQAIPLFDFAVLHGNYPPLRCFANDESEAIVKFKAHHGIGDLQHMPKVKPWAEFEQVTTP